MVSFNGKTIVITGGSSGIGRASALEFAKNGADVIVVGRNPAHLSEVASLHKNIRTIQTDFASKEGIEKASAEISKLAKEVNGFVHCAGVIYTEPFETFRNHELNEMLNVNVLSGFEIFRAVLPLMKNGGSAVFVSSIDAFFGAVKPPSSGYALTKGALVSLTYALSSELGEKNIRVNAVVPGLIRTPMTEDFFSGEFSNERAEFLKRVPLHRAGRAEEVAKLIAFLISDDASYINGDAIFIDGGYHAR
jgi:NAD(P)-dependent dehydrogenase (short-subunit alcohol dehydrogenase family)